MTLALGLMSGTSADGLSLALLEAPALRVRACATYPYSASLRRRILGARELKAPALASLSFELGRLYARSAARFLKGIGVAPGRLGAVGSHGQTVVHLPGGSGPATLQIGEASFLAEALGVAVVCDFRPRDMAAGGEGAPLIPFFDRELFGAGPPRALQNIGGIANVSLAGRGAPAVGFDTGPGNVLIDLAARRASGGRLAFDKNGALARRGKARASLVARLLRDPYFSRRPPKSLDRSAALEAWGPAFAALRGPDLVATATEFTAASIALGARRFIFPEARVSELVVSGGGALNPVLMGRLRELLAPLRVRALDELGVPAMAKEAAAMALMALRALEGRLNHCPEATGARGARVLGKIVPGPCAARAFARRKPAFR